MTHSERWEAAHAQLIDLELNQAELRLRVLKLRLELLKLNLGKV